MLHGYFATGRYTSTVLFVLSLLVMLSANWLPVSVAPIAQSTIPMFCVGIVPRVVSIFIYAIAAVLLSRVTFFDRGVKWMGALYMWIVALSTFINGNPLMAFSSLLFLVSIILLLLCQYVANPVRLLFTSFMILGVLAFVTPYSLYLIPLYLVFCSMANIFSAKGVAASILGLITPFWLVMGTAYLFPDTEMRWTALWSGMSAVFDIEFPGISLLLVLILLFVLVVLLPAIIVFVGSASPAKPLLRRRISFVIVASVYLLLLFCLVSGGSGFFYVCQLPFMVVLASYLFARKETKLLNIYLIVVNLIMVAIATQSLWLIH